jgi:TatD DNase family protein
VEDVLGRARDAGVAAVVCIVSSLSEVPGALALANEHGDVWATAGVHPHQAHQFGPTTVQELRDHVRGSPRIVALGETGLDHHYDFSPRADQLRSFEAHLELGVELDLPVVVHSRSCDREMEAVIRSAPAGVRGVLHCFSGDAELLDAVLERGWMVSYGGVATFKRFDGADLLRAVPDDRLMLETDSPYLAPVPLRGKRNEPANLPWIRDAIAEHRGVGGAELAAMTTLNAIRFFRLPISVPEESAP